MKLSAFCDGHPRATVEKLVKVWPHPEYYLQGPGSKEKKKGGHWRVGNFSPVIVLGAKETWKVMGRTSRQGIGGRVGGAETPDASAGAWRQMVSGRELDLLKGRRGLQPAELENYGQIWQKFPLAASLKIPSMQTVLRCWLPNGVLLNNFALSSKDFFLCSLGLSHYVTPNPLCILSTPWCPSYILI